MAITWMLHSDVFPDLDPCDSDFVAFDGEEIIGRVLQVAHGPEKGLWLWSMTVVRPGLPFLDRSGMEASRRDAGRRVVEAYERLLARQLYRGK